MFSILLNYIFGLSFALGMPIGGALRPKPGSIGLNFRLQKRDASALKGAMEGFQPAGPWSPWN